MARGFPKRIADIARWPWRRHSIMVLSGAGSRVRHFSVPGFLVVLAVTVGVTGLAGGAEPLPPAHRSAASWIGLSADLVAKTGSGTFDESALRTATQTVRKLGMGSIVQLPMQSARRDRVTQAGADLVHGPDLSTALSAEAFEATLTRQSDAADRESTWR